MFLLLQVNGVSYGTHAQIVKLLPRLFSYVSTHAELNRSVLEALWGALEGARPGDSMTQAVFQVIERVAGHLSLELLDYQYSLISTLTGDNFDEVRAPCLCWAFHGHVLAVWFLTTCFLLLAAPASLNCCSTHWSW